MFLSIPNGGDPRVKSYGLKALGVKKEGRETFLQCPKPRDYDREPLKNSRGITMAKCAREEPVSWTELTNINTRKEKQNVRRPWLCVFSPGVAGICF